MKQYKLVCMGDSLTEGYGLAKNIRWTNVLSKTLGVEVINSGISGDTTAGMLARFQRQALDYQPTHIIIMGGTNDLWMRVPDELILSNILAMTRQARHHDIEAIIGIPTPFLSEDELPASSTFLEGKLLSQRIAAYRQKLIQFAKEDERSYIDFGQDMKPKHFLEDGMHPNEAGQTLMAQHAKQLLDGVL